MDPINLTPISVMELLTRQREIERQNSKERDERYEIEQNKKLRELQNLQEEQSRIKINISKNLKSVAAQKHGLQKLVQGLEQDVPKLPVTHKYQLNAVSFVSDAINFVNDFPIIQNFVEPEDNVDTTKLCNEINNWSESVKQELNRSKTRVNQIESLNENIEIIRNHCFHPCDDENGLIE